MMNREEVLQKIFSQDPMPQGIFCIRCGAPAKQEIKAIGEVFQCLEEASHEEERAYVFEPATKNILEKGILIHETVGALIPRQGVHHLYVLLFLRSRFPTLYTLPAGHAETPFTKEENIKKEVGEETGLLISGVELLWEAPLRLQDPCRRGAEAHDWWMYEVMTEGEPRLSYEARIMGWYSEKEINILEKNQQLTKPTSYFLQRYFSR